MNAKFSEVSLIKRIEIAKSTIVPYVFNGNGSTAVPALLALADYIDQLFRSLFEPVTDWEEIEKAGGVPKKLAARVRSLTASINTISAKTGKLADQISIINDAHAAAEALPTDMESLEEARQRIALLESESLKISGVIESQRAEIEIALSKIKQSELEAAQLVVNCGDAYSAATTKGLGESFQNRADSLSRSMWIWVAGLVSSLGLGAWLGTRRVELIQQLVEKQQDTGNIGVYVALAFFSIAAPVWFAWIATKQIGQRFKLAEDYGFKASVAKAYEGYRREAAKLDESFASRLFGTALDRIDEAPLRFVEAESHGSPLHELLSRRLGKSRAENEEKERKSASPFIKPEYEEGKLETDIK